MSTTPFDIIAGPADVYVGAVGAAVPAVNLPDTDSSFNVWTKLGLTQGGVKVKHTQTIDLLKADQRSGPVKAIRSEEGLEVSFSIISLTLAKYTIAMNNLSPTVASEVQTITMAGFSGVLTFKLTYAGVEGATVFTRGTNATAAAIQVALRAATGDSGLTVTGTTDAGPWVITFTAGFAQPAAFPNGLVTVTSGTGGVTGTTVETTAGTRALKIYQGFDVAQFALLVRGNSPYGSFFLQYQIPVVVNDEEPEAAFARDGNAMLAIKLVALEDPNAATSFDRFGSLVAQTS